MVRHVLTILAASAALLAPAAAQSLLDTSGGRYEMQPVEGGIARLDTVSGNVEFCRVADDAIVCTGSRVDDPEADDLAGRISDLEARVEELEDGRRALLDSDGADRAVDQIQKLFRGFADIVRELDDDIRGDDRAQPDGSATGEDVPGRT
ncbi:hypothetical protein VQ042_11895 [Aurantimonas sp. A2-1-M11]|uniref:hypothetical protein n=1 Tax=Aurantimonas sp. A2-1-M11 TaxID=3113712 RepID=UPI002F95E270